MANEFGGTIVVGNSFAPDVFADEAVSFEVINGTVRITFATAKMAEPVPPSALELVIVGRLVIGAESAQRLAISLFDFLKNQGLEPSAVLGDVGKAPN